jgi:spermidine synthase
MRAALGALAVLPVVGLLAWPIPSARAEEPFDPEIRAAMLQRKDGLIAHVESAYNDIFVTKNRNVLKLAFQWKGWFFQESQINLADPDDLPMLYSRLISIATIYPQEVKRVLVLGLGGGAIPTYLGRSMPETTISSVELDPAVIDVAKKYFGMRETGKSRLIDSDGRVFLKRHSDTYDIIMVDAFTGSYIPFHLMTKEFYALVRERLAPHGVAVFNIMPGTKLYDSNIRTLRTVFDRLDLYRASDPSAGGDSMLVMAPLDPAADPQALAQKAIAVQERYKFRFDVAQLAAASRTPTPEEPKGEVLTDDFAPANIYDAEGRRFRRRN